MASILVIGRDEALMEGLAQMLAHAGHATRTAHTALEAAEAAAVTHPLVVIVDRGEAAAHPELARLPLESGGAVLVYHDGHGAAAAIPAPLQRLVMAELTLPLERHRLITLVQRVDERVRATGRHPSTPPEHHAG